MKNGGKNVRVLIFRCERALDKDLIRQMYLSRELSAVGRRERAGVKKAKRVVRAKHKGRSKNVHISLQALLETSKGKKGPNA